LEAHFGVFLVEVPTLAFAFCKNVLQKINKKKEIHRENRKNTGRN
jgi:hypothetical protein